jgi:peptide/nickel transport system permease protein
MVEEGSLRPYVVRRTLLILPALFGLVVLVFVISRLLPGDVAQRVLGPLASAQALADFRHLYGLDQPIPVQFYHYLVGLISGDWGISFRTSRPVLVDIEQYFPATIELTTTAMIIAIILGVAIGTVAATSGRKYADAASRLFSVYAVSLPEWWTGIIAQLVLAFSLGIFPPTGRLDYEVINAPVRITGLYVVDSILTLNGPALANSLWHLALPSLVLSLGAMAQIARMTRSSLLEQSAKDYVTFERANGMPSRIVTYKYMLKCAFSSVLTIIGLTYGFLLGGDFLVESVFAWPGLGYYGVQALLYKDFNAVVGVVLTIGVSFAIVNLVVDLLYGMLDPRVRYGKAR